MQEIAFDLEIVDSILSNSSAQNSINKLIKISQNLKDYHKVIDSITENEISFWQESINKIKRKHHGHAFVQFLDILFSPLNLNFNPVPPSESEDKFEYYINQSPDKIGITEKKEEYEEKYFVYSSDEFIENYFDNRNNLFRLTKVINYKKGDKFYPQVFYPYLREAKKIEYLDKYLFAEASDLDKKLILSLIKESQSLKEMVFYTELNFHDMKLAFKKGAFNAFKKSVKKQLRNVKIEEMKQYNSRENHDRFLIVDSDRYSITITTSTNNLEIKGDKFVVKKPFKIIFSKGRDYID